VVVPVIDRDLDAINHRVMEDAAASIPHRRIIILNLILIRRVVRIVRNTTGPTSTGIRGIKFDLRRQHVPLYKMLHAAATLQISLEYGYGILNCIRKKCIPYILAGGRDMVLLDTGEWIDDAVCSFKARYDSDKNTIALGSEPVTRWKWIAASTPELDMTDFFSSLRVSRSVTITDRQAIMLYIHQTGQVPKGKLTVIHRDGSDHYIELKDMI